MHLGSLLIGIALGAVLTLVATRVFGRRRERFTPRVVAQRSTGPDPEPPPALPLATPPRPEPAPLKLEPTPRRESAATHDARLADLTELTRRLDDDTRRRLSR